MHMRPDMSYANVGFRLCFQMKKTQSQADLQGLIRAKLAAIATLIITGSEDRLKYTLS